MSDDDDDLFSHADKHPRPLPTPPKIEAFDGETYEPDRDHDRLQAQVQQVYSLMADANWRTLADIAEAIGSPEASISARLRDLRKEKFGSHTVEREYVSKGLWRYRLLINRGS